MSLRADWLPRYFVIVLLLIFADHNVYADSLSVAYSRAQEIVSSYRASGRPLQSAMWPSGATLPSTTPSLDLAISKEITYYEGRAKKLSRSREAWRLAIETFHRNGHWQDELDFWIEESQVAQIGALESSVGLLIGISGPVAEAIEVHHGNSVKLWESAKKTRDRLDQVNALLHDPNDSAREMAELVRARETLRSLYNDFAHSMKSEQQIADRFGTLEKTADRIIEAARWTERGNDIRQKHNLLLANKAMQDIVVDILKDAGLTKVEDRLLKKGLAESAKITKLGNFLIEYGYHSMRFYFAFVGVHDVLAQISDRSKVEAVLNRKIIEATNDLSTTQKELDRLKSAKGTENAAVVLQDIRQKESKEAYLLGEWFSAQTGIRAEGSPILR